MRKKISEVIRGHMDLVGVKYLVLDLQGKNLKQWGGNKVQERVSKVQAEGVYKVQR